MSGGSDDLVDFYTRRIEAHGLSYEAMWGDAATWKSAARFHPLSFLPVAEGDVLVDIGCGIGALAGFARDHLPPIRYIGVEAVPDFAAAARAAGLEVVEIDAFATPERLPEADWYVTFGTLNKDWSVADLPGEGSQDRILGYVETLYARARKGVACSFVTDVVEYRKPGVANMDPAAVIGRLRRLTPHFTVWHGYAFYEFFAAAWRGAR